MNTRRRITSCCGLLFLCAGASRAQQAPTPTILVGPEIVLGPQGGPVLGEPYSAETVTENSQTLADGTHIFRKSMLSKTYRDSEGRTRSERYMMRGRSTDEEEQATLMSVLILDPVSNIQYFLNVQERTAQEMDLPPRPAAGRKVTNTTGPRRPVTPNLVVEDLGTQVMEGLEVEGQRITRTIPTGAEGNDRPMAEVTERWLSKELQCFVLIRSIRPEAGETTNRTTNIERSEPEPALFRVPADYTITQEQPGHFQGVGTVIPLK
jgi:hypothetical protein